MGTFHQSADVQIKVIQQVLRGWIFEKLLWSSLQELSMNRFENWIFNELSQSNTESMLQSSRDNAIS